MSDDAVLCGRHPERTRRRSAALGAPGQGIGVITIVGRAAPVPVVVDAAGRRSSLFWAAVADNEADGLGDLYLATDADHKTCQQFKTK
ncbi:MAG: hypothetical protein KC613_08210 [Myxococcales bacterium]|nr:hypothetical protein [Myxococcales bacterium]